MTQLQKEIEANFANFHTAWQKQLSENIAELEKSPLLGEAYKRLTAFQAFRDRLIDAQYSKGSAAFFLEAQNDALISLVSAASGSWRPALQSLRGVIENSLSAVYYKDHPVELLLWENGTFKISPSDLRSYAGGHPALAPHEAALKIAEVIGAEYATLSKAVHAAAASFRMTEADSGISLWTADKAKLGMWATRHKKVVEAVLLMFSVLHSKDLQGLAHSDVRTMMHFAISSSKRVALKNAVKVTVSAP